MAIPTAFLPRERLALLARMTDIFPPAKQRPALLALRETLGSRENALRRDECGDWRISGQHGWIYAVAGTLDQPDVEGFLLHYSGPEYIGSARGWGFAKRAFEAFGCVTTLDGDGEGIVFLDRLATVSEAETIRGKLGIAKKRVLSDEERERLISLGRPFEKRSEAGGAQTRQKTASRRTDGGRAPNACAGENP